MENSVAFLKLRDCYKSSLLEDIRLTKAVGLAAQQELLLNGPQDAAWKVPRLKSLNKQLRVWSKKIRQPGEASYPSSPDEESNLAVGPTQKFMGNIAKLKERINRPAATPQVINYTSLFTPKSEPGPSSKKPKLESTSSSSKKQTSKKQEPESYESTTEFESAPESPKDTALTGKQAAHAFIQSAKAKSIAAAKSKAQELALKKLKTQPGWLHFGPPLKRKLHGSDWKATPPQSKKK